MPRLSIPLAACLALAASGPVARAEGPPRGALPVRRIKVVTDRAPDCSSLKTIVESVTRGCKTNDEKAIALYNFMQLTHYHQGYPGEEGGLGALKEINVYGWSLCGGLHTVEAALWRETGLGVALRRLERPRPHHRRGAIRRPLALLRRPS